MIIVICFAFAMHFADFKIYIELDDNVFLIFDNFYENLIYKNSLVFLLTNVVDFLVTNNSYGHCTTFLSLIKNCFTSVYNHFTYLVIVIPQEVTNLFGMKDFKTRIYYGLKDYNFKFMFNQVDLFNFV